MRIVIEPLIILPKSVCSRLVIAFISLSSLLVIVVLVIGFQIDGNEETMFGGKGMKLYNTKSSSQPYPKKSDKNLFRFSLRIRKQ